jgi:hypothetical protein
LSEDINGWQIKPHAKGDLLQDDWHLGLADFQASVFPLHLDNKLYIMGWSYALGMNCGYKNFPCPLNEAQCIEGWQIAQHERYCRGEETLMPFSDE